MNGDSLAEKMPNWNPYAYTFNNPINFTDSTGMVPEGKDDWVEWTSTDGTKHFTYDNDVKTVQDAVGKGYNDVSSVMESFHYSDESGMHHMRDDGYISTADGNVVDLHNNETYRTTDNTFFSKNKTGREQLLELGGAFGDFITLLGLVTLQPEIVAVGSYIGNGTLIGELDNPFATQGFNESTITEGASKVALNRASSYLGKAGVNASRKVAGDNFVKSGANKVTESVIEGSIGIKTKIIESEMKSSRKK